MAALDVRDEEITEIIFAESGQGHTDRLIFKESRYGGRTVDFMAGNEENGYDFRLDDIDNLIKALQKAKALWGGK